MSNPSLKSDSSPKSERDTRAQHRRKRHLNLRAAVVLTALLLSAGVGLFFARTYQVHHQRSALLAEAKKLLAKQPPEPNLALTYLDKYLELNPRDIDALDLKSKVLFDLVRSYDQALGAIPVHEKIVRVDSQHKGDKKDRPSLRWPAAWQRLVQLNLAVGRPQTAHTLAEDLVQSGTDATKDAQYAAENYRLLGRTLLALGVNGAATIPEAGGGEINVWQEAIKNYEASQRLDPSNVEGARYLAYLYQTQRNEQSKGVEPKAVEVLDRLLKNSQGAAEQGAARLVRYDYFIGVDQPDKALVELKEAVRLRPSDPEVRLKAAMDALRRGETDLARHNIEAIPPEPRSAERRHALIGEVDVRENKIDEAIENWREGLKATGGTSDILTWRLAFVLLRLGRPEQAKPLVDQYHRLTDRAEATPKAVFLDALLALKENRPAEAREKLEEIRLKALSTSAANQGQALDDDQSLGAEVAFTLGQSYEALGLDQQALDAYRQASKAVRGTRGLKWADPWLGAANVLVRQGTLDALDAAASELQDGLFAMPDDPNMLIALGRILLVHQARLSKDRQDWGPVEAVLKRAQQVAPTSADVVKLQVAYLAPNGRLTEAANLLAAATDPKYHAQNPELWALQADVLRRLGKPDQAFEALDRGTTALGEQAILWIARSQVLSSQGREKAAYDALTEGIQRVPPEQRPRLLEALGSLHRNHNDPAAARAVYAQWANLEPLNPQPHLVMLELALAADDEPAAQTAAAALEKIGGLPQLLAQAMLLLREQPGQAQDPKQRTQRLEQAKAAIEKIVQKFPTKPVGYLLQGQLFEQQGNLDKAIEAYRRAHDNSGGPEAIRLLWVLLARQRRFDDLRRLRAELHSGELTPDVEQLAAGIALALGEKDEAERMVQELVRVNPQGRDIKVWEARILSSLGKPKQAEEILQLLIQQRPEELEPRITLMMLQLSQRQTEKAAETVEQIRTQAKIERPELVWAGCYLAIGNLARASEYYKASLQKWPNDQEVRQRAVAFFRATGRLDDAEGALREAQRRDPENTWIARELAQILSARRNDPNAWQEAMKLVSSTSSETETAEDRLVRATVLARSVDPARRQEAIPLLEGLIASSPGAVSVMAHELLARIYIDAKQLPKAAEHAQAIAKARPANPDAVAFCTEVLIRASQLDEAGRQVDRLDQLETDSLRAIGLRALILQAQGKAKDAAALLERRFAGLEKENSLDDETQGRRIIDLLINLEQFDAAERVGRRLAERRPKSACVVAPTLARRGQLNEALAYCRKSADAGNPSEAATTAAILVATHPLGTDAEPLLKQTDAILSMALKQQPDNFALLFSRASVERLQGRYQDAVQTYRALLAKNPDNAAVLNNMAWTLSEDLNQPDEAIEKIDSAIKQMGRDPSLLDTRGVILTRLDKSDLAILDLEAAVQSVPSASIDYHLARAYHKAGREAECQKYRALAKQAGLSPSRLQPSEQAEMDKLMNHH